MVLIINLLFVVATHAYTLTQTPLLSPARPAKLHGRFLHLTDIHPDPLYQPATSASSSCHNKAPKSEQERAGYWGTPWHECDSPLRLVNLTFDYLAENWADEVDFVIWTGDSARHDNDREQPRTPTQIYDQNRDTAARMQETFTKRGVPVVPTLGNNDVWPHNILSAGPNPITNTFVKIWETFIPFSSYQVFQRGGYHSVEVIPNKVAVISLNTMYFYHSNKAVSGCTYKVSEDPGNLQFDWLDVQLGLFRKRGMQVYVMGHVPPGPSNYYPECFRRYAEIALRFQDTILGHIYGHMNVDYFSFVSDADLHAEPLPVGLRKGIPLEDTLLEDFTEVPKISKTNEDDYAVILTSPGVVPNPYLPSIRVFAYNTTDGGKDVDTLEEDKKKKKKKGTKKKHNHEGKRKKEKECKKKKNRDTWACRPLKKRYSDAGSPSRSNTLWTPLGYAQFYMPDLQTSNKTHPPNWELEYVTYRVSALHHASRPVPVHLLPPELRNASESEGSLFAPYGMGDLTVGSWLRLARAMVKDAGLWARFKSVMYLGG